MRSFAFLTFVAVSSQLAACGDDSSQAGGSGGSSAGGSGQGGSSSNAGGGGTGGSPGSGEPAALQGITALHNAARANVDPPAATALPPLEWSDEIAAVAQAYAELCVFEHSGGSYGENLYANAGQPGTVQDVVDGWVSEVADYDYESNTCSGVCGHYTQVVWAGSLRLGCGVASCTTGSPFQGFDEWQHWVCNYDPPGNFVGERPY
ncbi:MAG: Fis family transcriptional regulator [Polyangiaceae bacterium]|jgi:pathogenesis-related protein 1|nr:Fis family transcriptional regulator [Polyangiaceae bacterium]MBK8940421.1 Fis family transcriptional regulator [Polyangiaceae bacterium]